MPPQASGRRRVTPPSEPAIAAGVPSTGVSPSAKVWRGWSEKVAAPCSAAAARASSVVAPLTWPTRAGAAAASSGADRGDRIVGDAEKDARLRRAAASTSSCADEPRPRSPARSAAAASEPAHAAATDHDQGRGAQGGGEVIPFQFPHRRYQTALLVRTRWRGFGALFGSTPPIGRGPRRSIESGPGQPASRCAASHTRIGAICERKPRPDGREPELPSTRCRSTSSSASRAVTASRSWWAPMWAWRPPMSLPGVRLGEGGAPAFDRLRAPPHR